MSQELAICGFLAPVLSYLKRPLAHRSAMISGVTAEVSWVLRTAPATLTPTIAVPPRLGCACALAGCGSTLPRASGPPAATPHLIKPIAALLADLTIILAQLPRRRPWRADVRVRCA